MTGVLSLHPDKKWEMPQFWTQNSQRYAAVNSEYHGMYGMVK